jgi:hypothetical protein
LHFPCKDQYFLVGRENYCKWKHCSRHSWTVTETYVSLVILLISDVVFYLLNIVKL